MYYGYKVWGGKMWNDQQSQLVLSLKLKQLKRRGFVGLTMKDLETVFSGLYQRKNISKRLSAKVDLVFNTTDDDIVKLLAVQSRKDAYSQTLKDFNSLIKNGE